MTVADVHEIAVMSYDALKRIDICIRIVVTKRLRKSVICRHSKIDRKSHFQS